MAGRDADHRVEKTLPSALRGTNLEAWLRARHRHLTLAGYMTHNCVLSTVIDAAQASFVVEVLADASGSVPYANEAGDDGGNPASDDLRAAAVALRCGGVDPGLDRAPRPRPSPTLQQHLRLQPGGPRLRVGAVTLS